MNAQIKPVITDLVPEVKKVLDNNYAADSVATLAIYFNVSRNTLQDAFKQEYGISIRAYKLKQRMEVAKQLIEEGKSIKEIAITLRYGTISSFSRAFKKYYGVTPTECHNAVPNV